MDKLLEDRLRLWLEGAGLNTGAAMQGAARKRGAASTFAELVHAVLIPTMKEFGGLLRGQGFDYQIGEGRDAARAGYVRLYLIIPDERRASDHAPSMSFTEQAETATALVTIITDHSLSSIQEVAMLDLDRSQVIRHLMVFVREVLAR